MSGTAYYLVRRLAWEGGELEHGCRVSVGAVNERQVPVTTFGTEREAKADAHRRNVVARTGRSPFWFADVLSELTDLSVEEAAARLVHKGLPAPPPRPADDRFLSATYRAWREWWDRESVNWTAEQLADAWAVFDKLRFYDVVEIEMED